MLPMVRHESVINTKEPFSSLMSTKIKGPESKAEEKSKVEAPEKCSEFDTIKDAKEEVKSLEGEREAE